MNGWWRNWAKNAGDIKIDLHLKTIFLNYSFFRALSLYSSLDKLKSEIVDLKHSVAESLISPAKKSIEELQQDLSKRINLEELKINLDSLNLDKLQLPSPQLVSAEEQKAGR